MNTTGKKKKSFAFVYDNRNTLIYIKISRKSMLFSMVFRYIHLTNKTLLTKIAYN